MSILCTCRGAEIAGCRGEGEGCMCSSGMETSVSGYRIIISLQSPSSSAALSHNTHTYTLTTASSWNNMLSPHVWCVANTHFSCCVSLHYFEMYFLFLFSRYDYFYFEAPPPKSHCQFLMQAYLNTPLATSWPRFLRSDIRSWCCVIVVCLYQLYLVLISSLTEGPSCVGLLLKTLCSQMNVVVFSK